MSLQIKIGSLLFLIPVLSWAANIRIQTSVDRKQMNPRDELVYTVEIQSDGSIDSEPPKLEDNLKDFTITSQWANQSTQGQMVLGKGNTPEFTKTEIKSFQYRLSPKHEGKLSIPAVPLQVDGITYYTQAYLIQVTSKLPSSEPDPGEQEDDEDPFSQLLKQNGLSLPPGFGNRGVPRGFKSQPFNEKEAFFIQVEVDKTDAYIGEQVTASWYLYTRGILRDIDTLKYPSLHGFWKEDIEVATQLNFQQVMVNGVPYKKALLASFALFPMREGRVEIDPYTAKCTVIPANDMFGMFGVGKPYTFTKSSLPVKINTRPVPTEGKPSDYSGAIGQFQFTARLDDPNISNGQPFSLKLRFEGQGNAKPVELPPLQLPEGLELYEIQKESQFFKNGTSFKEFNVLVIPRKEGNFAIPEISVSVFNPATKKYERKIAPSINITVGPAKAGATIASKPLAENKEAPPILPGLQTENKVVWQMPVSAKVWPLISIFFIGLVLLGQFLYIFGWQKRRASLLQKVRVKIQKVEKESAKIGPREVAVHLTNIFYQVLGEVSGLGGASLEIDLILEKGPPSIRRELGAEIKKRIELLQTIAFAPEGLVKEWNSPEKQLELCSTSKAILERAIALSSSEEIEAEPAKI